MKGILTLFDEHGLYLKPLDFQFHFYINGNPIGLLLEQAAESMDAVCISDNNYT